MENGEWRMTHAGCIVIEIDIVANEGLELADDDGIGDGEAFGFGIAIIYGDAEGAEDLGDHTLATANAASDAYLNLSHDRISFR